jgi:response regulator RpfG family c-di-GMP phosphodiesterase
MKGIRTMRDKTSRKINVLIVDDNYHLTRTIGYYIKDHGYNPLSAFTIKEFEALAPEADIIILDIRLPEKEGAPIDPWGGLKALNRMIEKSEEKASTQICPSRVIIRSMYSKADAESLGKTIPEHHCWLDVNGSLAKLIDTLEELTDQIRKAEEE